MFYVQNYFSHIAIQINKLIYHLEILVHNKSTELYPVCQEIGIQNNVSFVSLLTRYPRMSGQVILVVERMMRSLVVECGVAAMSKPWGMRRAGSQTPAQRHHLRSRCDQMPWSRPSSDPRTCWTLKGIAYAKPEIWYSYFLSHFCLVALFWDVCCFFIHQLVHTKQTLQTRKQRYWSAK